MKQLTFLGAGLSGLSCAHHFPATSTIYEAKETFGGTASSMFWQGFTFDYGPHVSFTKDSYIRSLFAKTVNEEYWLKNVSNSNYYNGQWVRHPAISNLCDLPKEMNRDALISFIEAQDKKDSELRHYRDWCELGQGQYFAENFTHVYTRKFWTVEPEEMTYQWAGDRVSRPGLERVIDGSLGLQKDTGYYYTEFRYPKRGGYGAYSNFWKDSQERINFKFNHRVTQINLNKRTLSFEEQPDAEFGECLISSLPLPEFVRVTSDAPEEVRIAANKLRFTSIALINIALNEPTRLPYHWFYVYDEDILTPRVTIYSNLSEFNAPSSCTALQAEVPYSISRPLPSNDVVEKVLLDLEKCGIINHQSVINAWQVNLKYGYVIFDHQRDKAVKVIHNWMRENGVEPIGRFGLWQYLWSDQAVKSGRAIVDKLSVNL